MKYRQLGASDLRVSAIGLGCLGMAFARGTSDHARGLATLDRALDLGINFFDTADGYGGGRSEELIGDAFRRRRDKVVIATKFGNLAGGASDRKVDGRPEYVAKACDATLKRLGLDVIDLYYQHRVDPLVPIEDSVGAMKLLVEQGKVRHLGLSEVSPTTLARAHATHPITALQNEYSLWAREPEDEILSACRGLGVALVSYSPLGRGFLTGQIRSEEALPANDWRRKNPRFSADNISRNITMLAALESVARRLGAVPAQVALAWVLAQGNDIVPIPGTTRQDNLELNAASVDLCLTSDDLAALSQAFPRDLSAGPRHNEDAMRFMNG